MPVIVAVSHPHLSYIQKKNNMHGNIICIVNAHQLYNFGFIKNNIISPPSTVFIYERPNPVIYKCIAAFTHVRRHTMCVSQSILI